MGSWGSHLRADAEEPAGQGTGPPQRSGRGLSETKDRKQTQQLSFQVITADSPVLSPPPAAPCLIISSQWRGL